MYVDNPFFHRGAIRRAEEFHGRQAEIGQIMGLFRNGQSVSIVGPRRIGKTSLLLHLCRESTRRPFGLGSPETLFAMIDCQELGGSPPEEAYEILLTAVADAAEESALKVTVNRPGSYHALDRVLKRLYEESVSVVVLLDEFELLAANPRLTPYFFARLRGLTTKYGLAYLTTSQRPLFAISADERILSSPFFNIFISLSLGLFSESEARDLIAARLRGTPVDIGSELTEYMLCLVGPHPFFLHIAGYHAFQEMILGKPFSDASGEHAFEAAIEMEAESHLGYLWHNLTDEERYCLALREGPVETLRQLEQQCLLRQDGGGYLYTSELVRRFVRRQQVPGLIQAGPFVIDRQRHEVWADGKRIDLTTSQFDLLVRLGIGAGHVVPGSELEAAVWGDALLDDPDRLKTLIKRLRRAIEPLSSWIVSERGVGYALREPE
jgi:hypothetical protein